MQSSVLNTHNPAHLLYKYEALEFAVLGGIKMDTLNTMRATIKIKHFASEQRHTLDLYNNNALQRFLKVSAEHLAVGIPYIQKATAALINELEDFRMKEIEKESHTHIKTKVLTAEETQAAETFLKQPELLKITNEQLAKTGIVGEEVNRLIMYIIFTSRKLNNPLHIISLAASGTGKSYLQEKVSQVIPEEDKKEITALSPNSFYYQGTTDLKHKLILLEDLTGAENSLYPIRELQSKKYIIKEVSHKNSKGDTITITKRVEGPVCISACTTTEQVYEDNANRSFLIYLDDSKEQDERIMQYQRKQYAGKIDKAEENAVTNLIKNVQRILKPVTILNPYAEHLILPSEVFKKRRTNAHYLQFIEAITFYHQYQREEKVNTETGEIFIETTIEDIKEANELIKHILLRKSDELSGALRDYYEKLKTFIEHRDSLTETNTHEKLQTNESTTNETIPNVFTNKEIREIFRLPATTVRRYHSTLYDLGYLKKIEENKAKGFRYQIVDGEEYLKLKHSVSTALSQALIKAEQAIISNPTTHTNATTESATEPTVRQNQNGSLKKQKTSKVNQENH